MHSLLRLLRAVRAAPRHPTIQHDRIDVVLDDGKRVDVALRRDPRARRIKLSVDERGARLTLPQRASRASGERFLHAHIDWLTQQLATQAIAAGMALRRDHTSSLPLHGAELPLRWERGRTTRLDLADDGCLHFITPAHAGDPALRRALRDFYEAQARAAIGRWLPRYVPGLPRAPGRIVFKRTTSLWGSMAPDGTMALDLALPLARPAAFEYVLVHELCHLLQANHSPRFWREVEARFPDWRRERDYLHGEGRALKARLRGLLAG
ncbi:MAG: M48 family metallopeptidase [Thermomonas sp.]|uniref:M48 family metallopeptidase n=1 Tax=Thermomonas sp. TaxID=1971895 RepID=UPI002621BB83|nr:SprT family zinc-dependent metalloprotease [Thermomonas sp.]MCC7096959.1 M48 family metallopeptidase [Thermomonas sp.]